MALFEFESLAKGCRHLVGIVAWTWAIFVFLLHYFGRGHYNHNNNNNEFGAPPLFQSVFVPVLKVLLIAPGGSLAIPTAGNHAAVQSGQRLNVDAIFGNTYQERLRSAAPVSDVYCAGCNGNGNGFPAPVQGFGQFGVPKQDQQQAHSNTNYNYDAKPLTQFNQQPASMQYIALQDNGQYSWAYKGPESSRAEQRSIGGFVQGQYSYTEPGGQKVEVQYTAGPNQGFTATGNSIAQPQQQVPYTPYQVEDTPEVKAERQRFFAAYEEQLRLIESTRQQVAQNVQGGQQQQQQPNPVAPQQTQHQPMPQPFPQQQVTQQLPGQMPGQYPQQQFPFGQMPQMPQFPQLFPSQQQQQMFPGQQQQVTSLPNPGHNLPSIQYPSILGPFGQQQQNQQFRPVMPQQPMPIPQQPQPVQPQPIQPYPIQQQTRPVTPSPVNNEDDEADVVSVDDNVGNQLGAPFNPFATQIGPYSGKDNQAQTAEASQPSTQEIKPEAVAAISGQQNAVPGYFYFVSVGNGNPYYVTSNPLSRSNFPMSLKATLVNAIPVAAVHDAQVPNVGNQKDLRTSKPSPPVYVELNNGNSGNKDQAMTYSALQFNPSSNTNSNNNGHAYSQSVQFVGIPVLVTVQQ